MSILRSRSYSVVVFAGGAALVIVVDINRKKVVNITLFTKYLSNFQTKWVGIS